MKKIKTVLLPTFTISIPMEKRELKVKDISKTKQQIMQDIKSELKDTVEHFKLDDGGWKLDKYFIQSSIINKILGFSIEDEINQAIINEGLVIEYTGNGEYIRTKEEYNPIYMNGKTGKLYLIENSDDKSYLDKFNERNGYVEIGRL